MRMITKLILCVGIIATPLSFAATQQAAEQIEMQRARGESLRQQAIAQAMDFNQGEGATFWPLYREFRNEMASVLDRKIKLVLDYADAYPDVSAELANTMLDEFISIQKAELKVKEKFMKKFRKILTPQQTARFFQADNKLDAIANFDAAQQIPLVTSH